MDLHCKIKYIKGGITALTIYPYQTMKLKFTYPATVPGSRPFTKHLTMNKATTYIPALAQPPPSYQALIHAIVYMLLLNPYLCRRP